MTLRIGADAPAVLTSDPAVRDATLLVAAYLLRFPDEASRLEPLRIQLREDARILARSNMRGHITTSALVLDASRERALFIHHRALDLWLQPGGHYEPPGSLWDSARREVAEETGLADVRVFGGDGATPFLADIDIHAIPARPGKGEGAHVHLDYAFLALAGGEFAFAPQAEEVHDVRWIRVADLLHFDDSRTRRLAAKALAAIAADGAR